MLFKFYYCSKSCELTYLFISLLIRELDLGLEKPIASILWAAPRLQVEIQELRVISDELTMKYGKEFTKSCHSNQLGNVDEKLMHKLSVEAPPRMLVEKYLEEIAKTYNVRYVPDIDRGEVLTAERLLVDFEDQRGGGGDGKGPYDSKGAGAGGNSRGGGACAEEPLKPPPTHQTSWQPMVLYT